LRGNESGTLKHCGTSETLEPTERILAFGGYADNGGEGAVWVYTFTGSNWEQMGNKLVGTDGIGANQGYSIALSGDGKTLASGGIYDSLYTGAVWVFTLSGGNWSQVGNKLKGKGANNGAIGSGAFQGSSVSLSYDGKTLASGGYNDSSGIGAVWIYTLTGSNWNQMGNKLVGTGLVSKGWQGNSISLSSDGGKLAVGSFRDSVGQGAVWVYELSNGKWNQMGNKLRGTGASSPALQGSSVSLSYYGTMLAVGGPADNFGKGAIWVYTLTGSNWEQLGNKIIGSGAYNVPANAYQGYSVSISSNGKTLASGAPSDSSGMGAVWVYNYTGIFNTEISNYEYSSINQISVYPNPSSQSFSIISIEDYPYIITDLQGGSLEIGNTLRNSVGSGLRSGIYQLKVNNKVYKIVKI
jgi:hypothetical protein